MRVVCKLGLALCALPLLMGASVYRWVDETGVVNYTQIKPEGVPSQRVSADTGRPFANVPAAPDAAAAPQPALTDNQQKMLEGLRAAEAARQAEVAKVREANCEQARAVLERLSARGRIRVVGDDGEQRVMPDEERQQRISQAQGSVAANCATQASR